MASPKQRNVLLKEIGQIVRLDQELQRNTLDNNIDLDAFLTSFKKILALFNKKYPHITLGIHTDAEIQRMTIHLDVASPKQAFEEAASKIQGVQLIGVNKIGTASVQNQAKFAAELEKADTQLFITYFSEQKGASVVALFMDKEKVRLEYDPKELTLGISPEFELFAHYALQKVDDGIEIYENTLRLGSQRWATHEDRIGYRATYDPRTNN